MGAKSIRGATAVQEPGWLGVVYFFCRLEQLPQRLKPHVLARLWHDISRVLPWLEESLSENRGATETVEGPSKGVTLVQVLKSHPLQKAASSLLSQGKEVVRVCKLPVPSRDFIAASTSLLGHAGI